MQRLYCDQVQPDTDSMGNEWGYNLTSPQALRSNTLQSNYFLLLLLYHIYILSLSYLFHYVFIISIILNTFINKHYNLNHHNYIKN